MKVKLKIRAPSCFHFYCNCKESSFFILSFDMNWTGGARARLNYQQRARGRGWGHSGGRGRGRGQFQGPPAGNNNAGGNPAGSSPPRRQAPAPYSGYDVASDPKYELVPKPGEEQVRYRAMPMVDWLKENFPHGEALALQLTHQMELHKVVDREGGGDSPVFSGAFQSQDSSTSRFQSPGGSSSRSRTYSASALTTTESRFGGEEEEDEDVEMRSATSRSQEQSKSKTPASSSNVDQNQSNQQGYCSDVDLFPSDEDEAGEEQM